MVALPNRQARPTVTAASAVAAALVLGISGTAAGGQPSARPTLVVSSAGGVRAELRYTIDRTAVPYTGKDFSLAVERRGQPALYDKNFKPLCRYCSVLPGQTLPNRRVMLVRDVDRDGEPEIVVNLYWGGAHCCYYSYVYRWHPGARRYDRIAQMWGDAGYALRPDATFVSRDYAFFGQFDCFACSGAPLQVWAFRAGRFVDVTRAHRVLVARDIRRFARCLPNRARRGDDLRGCLAAWAGEEALLGRASVIAPTLERSRANGNVGPDVRAPLASGRYYIERVMEFLRARRYV
jgi:hypothetical protein